MTDVSGLSAKEAVEFLEWLDPVGLHNLVAIDPAGAAPIEARTFDFSNSLDREDVRAWIRGRGQDRRNLYFSVNAPKPDARQDTKLRRDEIGAVRAFHVDIDNLEGEPDWDPDCLPSAVIDSGGGRWGLWKLAQPIPVKDVAQLEAQNRALTARFAGDAQAHNLDRIARLPGTLNIPNAAKRKKGRVERVARMLAKTALEYHPDEIAEWCLPMIVAQNDSHSAKADQAPLAELDTPDNVLACIEYLAREVDVAVAGEGGRAVTISALHGCMDRGASWGMAAALCFANIKTEGEDWTLQDLRKLSKGLLPSRQNAPGIDSPALAEVEFGAVDVGDTDGAAPAKQTMAAEDFDSIEEDYTAAPNYLIEDWYDQESTVVTYGESNSGKTHVVLAQSIAIASGKPWAGKKVHQGLVVYVAAEGGRGLRRRLKAYKKTQPDLKGVPFALVAYPIALLHSLTDMKALVSLIKAEEAKFGQKCVMVVIDTLSRALAGGDENSSPDMGAFVKRCDGIRFATGATVHVVHHSGKNTAKGARGHSLLRAAVDTEIEIESNTILSRKQRDMEAPQELRFDYKPVLVGVRPDGSEVRSVVLDVWAQTEFTPNTSPQTQKVLEAAQAVVTQKTQIAGAENACSETAMFSVKEIVAFGVPERTAERSAKELVELGGFVKCKRGLYKLG